MVISCHPPPITRETIYRSFSPQPVAHALGPGRRLFERWSCKRLQARIPAGAANAECNAHGPSGSALRQPVPKGDPIAPSPHRPIAPSPHRPFAHSPFRPFALSPFRRITLPLFHHF
jgi:hypothetical protein